VGWDFLIALGVGSRFDGIQYWSLGFGSQVHLIGMVEWIYSTKPRLFDCCKIGLDCICLRGKIR
jgi:hypothetical protein